MFTQSPADRLVQDASAALLAGRIGVAETALRAALDADPAHAMALTRLAEIALLRKDHAQATPHLLAVLAIEPHFAPAISELSLAKWLAGERHESLDLARKALHIQPHNPRLRFRLAQFAAWMGLGAETRTLLAPILDAGSTESGLLASAHGLLGELAVAEARFHDANQHLLDSLRLMPQMPAPRIVLGMNQLRLGDYDNGWANYAEREQADTLYPDGRPPALGREWQGQDLAGRRIFIADDQGHGDSIQFFRYLPLLQALKPAHMTLRSFGPLLRLFREAAPYARVIDYVPTQEQFDFHCTSSSMPRWFGTTVETIPAPNAYLGPPSAPPRKRATRRRLQVGLAWSGDQRHMRDHLRSIPASMFLTIADVAGPRFHSLQHIVRPADQVALDARSAIGREVEEAQDFADTAALIARLDLVITVDTAIAHLAAAMGKPVWILLHIAPDWRWFADRSDSPWYPTARLFRVEPEEPGWSNVIRRTAAALKRLIAT